MNPNTLKYGMIAALAGLAGCGDVNAEQAAGTTSQPEAKVNQPVTKVKESVVTNANGSVTRTKTETKEYKDEQGHVIGHETCSYTETTYESEATKPKAETDKAEAETAPAVQPEKEVATDSFLGLKFGETPAGAEKAEDVPGEPALKVIKFKPAKALAGFDDYFAYVTPKTHRLVKVCACAKTAVDGGQLGRRHYLVEALENRYRTWARLASWVRPFYVFDIAPQRGVSVCLTDASDDYETVISAWDNDAARLAAAELREMRDAAYREAVERRNTRVKEAESAF